MGPMVLADATSEARLMGVLAQLIVVVAAARIFGWLFRRIGQPAVVGEIAAGLILGPSVLGKVEMAAFGGHPISETLFNPAAADIMSALSELGLILLLFLVGLEFEFMHVKRNVRGAVTISLVGMAVPFALGLALASWMRPHLEGIDLGDGKTAAVPALGLALFLGTALSITALPVLARMLMEWGITRTRLASVTLGAAAAGDAVGWIVLAGVSAVVHAEYSPMSSLRMAGLTLAFALGMTFIVRPVLLRVLRPMLARGGGELGLTGMALLLIVVMLSAMATSYIGIFAIFGAFVLGAALGDQRELRETVTRQLHGIVTVLFLPIFFTRTGLNTRVDALATPELWGFAGVICGAAIVGKLGGCSLAARVSGFDWRESLCIGSLMNTRGLMELIVINVGYELHVIPRSVYCMLVIMAVVTTVMTMPLVFGLRSGTEIDGCRSPAPFP